MRNSMGMTWTFQIMLIFILIFASFLAIYINFNKAFKMKNEVINIIERNEGISDSNGRKKGAVQLIANYLRGNAYSGTGYCPDETGWYGVDSLEGRGINDLEPAVLQKKYHYCVRKVIGYDDKNFERAYYEVIVFFKFDLPVVGNIYNFSVEGETIDIDFPVDSLRPAIQSWF